MAYFCSVCKKIISEGVDKFSKRHFGKSLCMEHQKTLKIQEKSSLPNLPNYWCAKCKRAISYGVFRYSVDNFDKPLCYDCQPELETKESAPPQKRALNNTSRIEYGGNDPRK